MLDPQQRQAASDMLWDCWQQGGRLSALPDRLRPATREEGYAVQALLDNLQRYLYDGHNREPDSHTARRLHIRGLGWGMLRGRRVFCGHECKSCRNRDV